MCIRDSYNTIQFLRENNIIIPAPKKEQKEYSSNESQVYLKLNNKTKKIIFCNHQFFYKKGLSSF